MPFKMGRTYRFLRFLCVADGEKARRELGFRPRHDIRATIQDFLGVMGEELHRRRVVGAEAGATTPGVERV